MSDELLQFIAVLLLIVYFSDDQIPWYIKPAPGSWRPKPSPRLNGDPKSSPAAKREDYEEERRQAPKQA